MKNSILGMTLVGVGALVSNIGIAILKKTAKAIVK